MGMWVFVRIGIGTGGEKSNKEELSRIRRQGWRRPKEKRLRGKKMTEEKTKLLRLAWSGEATFLLSSLLLLFHLDLDFASLGDIFVLLLLFLLDIIIF